MPIDPLEVDGVDIGDAKPGCWYVRHPGVAAYGERISVHLWRCPEKYLPMTSARPLAPVALTGGNLVIFEKTGAGRTPIVVSDIASCHSGERRC